MKLNNISINPCRTSHLSATVQPTIGQPQCEPLSRVSNRWSPLTFHSLYAHRVYVSLSLLDACITSSVAILYTVVLACQTIYVCICAYRLIVAFISRSLSMFRTSGRLRMISIQYDLHKYALSSVCYATPFDR